MLKRRVGFLTTYFYPPTPHPPIHFDREAIVSNCQHFSSDTTVVYNLTRKNVIRGRAKTT